MKAFRFDYKLSYRNTNVTTFSMTTLCGAWNKTAEQRNVSAMVVRVKVILLGTS